MLVRMVCLLQQMCQFQVFLEKYGYLDPENHIHNTAEVQSAIRWV
jgi:hypothetical protein